MGNVDRGRRIAEMLPEGGEKAERKYERAGCRNKDNSVEVRTGRGRPKGGEVATAEAISGEAGAG